MAGLEPSCRLIYRHLVPRVAMPPALKSKARKALCLCPMLTWAEKSSFPWEECSPAPALCAGEHREDAIPARPLHPPRLPVLAPVTI